MLQKRQFRMFPLRLLDMSDERPLKFETLMQNVKNFQDAAKLLREREQRRCEALDESVADVVDSSETLRGFRAIIHGLKTLFD